MDKQPEFWQQKREDEASAVSPLSVSGISGTKFRVHEKSRSSYQQILQNREKQGEENSELLQFVNC